jgi:hypothetical protein
VAGPAAKLNTRTSTLPGQERWERAMLATEPRPRQGFFRMSLAASLA